MKRINFFLAFIGLLIGVVLGGENLGTVGASEEISHVYADGLVWIPNTGSKYHSDPSCSKMKNPRQVTLAQALSQGYTACSKCFYESATPQPQPNPQPEPIDPSNPFTDVKKSAFYYDAVKWAVEKDITTGKSATTFGPTEDCKRQDVVTFLWRAAGSPEPKSAAGFSDVPANAYYKKAVDWAVENEITTGIGGGKFNPAGICTREQFVTFLWRVANKPTPTGKNNFTDVAAGKYYTDAVTWAAENKITTGVSPTKFDTGKNCNRGQVVTFLYRYYN